MSKKGKSNVQKPGTPPQDKPAQAPGTDDVRAAMLRVAHLIIEHPLVQLGLRVGDVERRRDIAVIKKWVDQEESNGGEA